MWNRFSILALANSCSAAVAGWIVDLLAVTLDALAERLAAPPLPRDRSAA